METVFRSTFRVKGYDQVLIIECPMVNKPENCMDSAFIQSFSQDLDGVDFVGCQCPK